MYTMRPGEFAYHRPTSVDEAVGLLDDDARPLAGGHSLLPMMKLRLATPAALVDLSGITGLDAIEPDGDRLRIGALATHAAVAASETVRALCPVLAEAAAGIGDPQVRNRGTIGGSLAHADPGADYPTVAAALGAVVTAQGPGGEREIPAGDLCLGIFTTALAADELVTSLSVPVHAAGTGGAYVKHAHPASGYAVVGVAAVVTAADGACSAARVVVGGVTGTPVEAPAAAEALVGRPGSPEAIAAAAETVPALLADAIGDTYASAAYRTHLAEVLTRRALATAFERAD